MKWMAFSLLVVLSACSTTKNLPEDEVLYIGIKDIKYNDSPEEREKTLKNDSAGVIVSIGNAVHKVDQLLSGTSSAKKDSVSLGNRSYASLNKEEKKQWKAYFDEEKKTFALAQTEVEAVLAYPPNNALLGSSSMRSPLQFGLWTYNSFVNADKKLGKWIFKHFATNPVLLSEVSPEVRIHVATNTLHNYGYFQGKVDYSLVPQKNKKKTKINYYVNVGRPTRLDSIAYMHFPARVDSLLLKTMSQRHLWKGDAFNVVNLSNEQVRIEKLFRENGYFYYTAPYTTFRADTIMRPGYMQLQVQPDPDRPAQVRHPWYIGKTYVTVRNRENDVLDQKVEKKNFTYRYSGDKIPLRLPMWRRSIAFRKGDLYRQSYENYSLDKLNQLEVFRHTDLSFVPRDTTATCDTLDLYVTALMDKLYDSSFEMNAVFKSNQQVGPGVSFGLAKRNAFRGGEKVKFKLFGSYEWQTGSGNGGGNSLLNSYELGTELSFEFPRFIFPRLGKKRFRFPSSTTFALNADWKNRAGFFNIVSLGTDVTYKWNKYRSSSHELTLFALDFDKMLHTTVRFDSIMNANPALSVSMRDQFIPSLGYTFTYKSGKQYRNPIWLQVSFKEAGNVVSGIYAAFGDKWSKRDKHLFDNPFAQFVKLTAEIHDNFHFSPKMSLATRLFGGVVYSYGNSTRAPYAEQFYVGGANSVRGFTVRTIGPGCYKSEDSKYAYIDQTGDLKLEANVEFRAKLLGSLHGAVFMDAGNVWLLRKDPLRPGALINLDNLKKIAVSTGLGFRYDLDFLVLRFDIGVPLHAPYDTGKSGWYNIHKFGKSLAYHFAIGYPF